MNIAFPVHAGSVSTLLITEVRLGGDAVLDLDGDTIPETKQYVTLYNQSGDSIDFSLNPGWKVQYAKSSFSGSCQDVSWSTEIPLTGALAANSLDTIEFQLTDKTAGAVRVIDPSGVVQDTVGWGAVAPCFETSPAEIPQNNTSLQRYVTCDGTYVGADTNNNAQDFAFGTVPLDQPKPAECVPACATNQQLINGACVNDVCSNINDFQAVVPDGYHRDGDICAILPDLYVTELLPNASGTDDGHEYIEFYNPNNEPIDLSLYAFYVGDDATKIYTLPAGQLAAQSYVVLYNDAAHFTLNNTSSWVSVVTIDGDLVDKSDAYENPKDDEAWALIDGTWQYTNQATPGQKNQPMSESAENTSAVVESASLKACAADQYRNPETNRCKKIVASQSTLAACKAGQYRNVETGRCRSTTSSSSLAPCKAGQYRSTETNRCRSLASATSAQTPCKEGWERNAETNRCRKVKDELGQSAFAVKPESTPDTPETFTGWWALGGVGALALGRIGWEWRNELLGGIGKIGQFFTSGK